MLKCFYGNVGVFSIKKISTSKPYIRAYCSLLFIIQDEVFYTMFCLIIQCLSLEITATSLEKQPVIYFCANFHQNPFRKSNGKAFKGDSLETLSCLCLYSHQVYFLPIYNALQMRKLKLNKEWQHKKIHHCDSLCEWNDNASSE